MSKKDVCQSTMTSVLDDLRRNHDWKCDKSARGSPGRPKPNSRCLWRCKTVLWNASVNFVATHCREICAQAAKQWPKRTPEHRVTFWSQLKEQTEIDPNFISIMTTVVESWVYKYDLEKRQQSSQQKTPNSSRRRSTTNSKKCQINA
jgi:hypothetical protein